MNKIKTLFCFSFLIFSFSFTYSQSWLWGSEGKGSLKSNDDGSGLAVDKAGNAYMTGHYENSLLFDTVTETNFSGTYIVKYNSTGAAVWGVSPGGRGYGTGAATDNFNNAFFTGFYAGPLTFGMNKIDGGGWDMYLAKYTETGAFKWAVTSSRGYWIQGSAVACDKQGDAYVTGYFQDSAEFGTSFFTSASINGNSTFLAKYDSNGNFLWARQALTVNDSGSSNQGLSVALDNSGNVFVTGFFCDTVYFGTSRLTSPKTINAYLAKYDPNGNLLWVKQSHTPFDSATYSAKAYSVTTDVSGNAYISGTVVNKVQFDSYTLTGYVHPQAFIVKFTPSGNVVWAKESGGSGAGGYSISSDKFNALYWLCADTAPDFSFGTLVLSPYGAHPSGVVKLDTSGVPNCGEVLYNAGEPFANNSILTVVSDSTGKYIYTAGTFNGDTIFCAKDTLVALSTCPYLARWNACESTDAVNEIKGESEKIKVYPNPFTNSTTLLVESSTYKAESYLELYDVTGRVLKKANFTGISYTLSAEGLAKGMYFVRVFDIDKNVIGTSKIVVQ